MIVVTGLGRSGTSMMMQMLTAGGLIPVAYPWQQGPTIGNPKGAFEHSVYASSPHLLRFLFHDKNLCIKLLAPYLHRMFEQGLHPAAIVLMHRPIDDVLASRRLVLGSDSYDTRDSLECLYDKSLEWLNATRVPYIRVDMYELISDPVNISLGVASFLQEYVLIPIQGASMSNIPCREDVHVGAPWL